MNKSFALLKTPHNDGLQRKDTQTSHGHMSIPALIINIIANLCPHGMLPLAYPSVAVGPVLNFWIYIWSDNQVAKQKLEEIRIINASTYFKNISSVNSLVL
jgi:hypothetical protein